MALYVAIADFDGDPTEEVPELSFRAGERIVIVDDDTFVPGSGWLLGHREKLSAKTAAAVPETYVQLEGTAVPAFAGEAAASIAPEYSQTAWDLWRQLTDEPLEEEMLKQSATDETVFRSYRFVLALDEGSLQFWRTADRSPFPRVLHIELPSIYGVQRVEYDDDPRASERLDFEFMYEGNTMRVRCASSMRCADWVRALTLLAGPNWTVLSGYGLSKRPPRPPHILGIEPGDREAAITVRSGRDSRVDYFTIRSRHITPVRDGWGGGTIENGPVQASDRCTTVVSTLPEGRPVVLPVRGLRNCVVNTVEISCGNYDCGDGPPAVLRVSPSPRAPGPPEIVEVINGVDSADLVLFVPDPGGAPIETVTVSALRMPPPDSLAIPTVRAVVPTRPGYGDGGQQMRIQVLGLHGGFPHVVTVTARNAGGEGAAVAAMAIPKHSGRAVPTLEPPTIAGIGTEDERAALQTLRQSELRAEATRLGVQEKNIAAAEDGNDAKRDYISLILQQKALLAAGLALPPSAGLVQTAPEVGWQGQTVQQLDSVEKWQGKYDTEAERPGDLAFNKYDIICVTVKHGIDRGFTKDAYWRGYLFGKDPATAGEFLQTHVMQPKLQGKGADRSLQAGIPGATLQVPPALSPTTAESVAEPHAAIFEFDGDPDEGDLQFAKGAIVMVTEKGDSDGEGRDGSWWKGFVHGKPETVGKFPSSYVKPSAGALPVVNTGVATAARETASAPAPMPAPAPAPAAPALSQLGEDIMPPNLTKMEQMLWKKKRNEPVGGGVLAPAPAPEPKPKPQPEPRHPMHTVPGPLAKAGKRVD
jgi:hypothetical protein